MRACERLLTMGCVPPHAWGPNQHPGAWGLLGGRVEPGCSRPARRPCLQKVPWLK